MAAEKKSYRGTIKKVVRIKIASCNSGVGISLERPRQGYGVVQGSDGKEFFFDDSAVQGSLFVDLRTGQVVVYRVEDGPFLRANYVSIELAGDPQLEDR